jgi:hypothetical protein
MRYWASNRARIFPPYPDGLPNCAKKYHPDVNPYKRKEYTEALAAFELLSFNASKK